MAERGGIKLQQFISVLLLCCCSTVVVANALRDWPQGAKNHDSAISYAIKDEKPVLIYFYADWCSYCKRLNRDYIDSPEFQALAGGFYRIQVNPEDSVANERLFKRKYRGTGYPSVFVFIPAFSQQPRKFHPFRKTKNLSQAEFAADLAAYVAEGYNKKARDHYQSRQYEKARHYLNQALSYEAENRYALFLTAITYHTEGLQTQDRALLEKAGSYYKTLLKIFPGDREIQAALQQLGE